jgi:hypothetical protein
VIAQVAHAGVPEFGGPPFSFNNSAIRFPRRRIDCRPGSYDG